MKFAPFGVNRRATDAAVTRTPGGVGGRREPPLGMNAGDVVEVEIERVGLVRNPVGIGRRAG